MPQSIEACPMIVTAQSLGSGSSGNALLVTAGEATLLIDCGVGIRAIRAALAERDRNLRDLNALLITHEHRDHVQTLPAVLHDELPMIATSGTTRAAELPREQTTVIAPNSPVSIAGATIHCLPTRHDAAEPCGFLIELGGVTIAVMTDLGTWQDHLAEAASSSDLVLIEANYNDAMLRHGPYPAYLKRRVASGVGHLANAACGQAIAPVAKYRGVKTTWWLSHLSKTNNSPDQALADVREHVRRHNADASITPLPRQAPGPRWEMTVPPSTPSNKGRTSTAPTQIFMPGLD
ncbi:MAG: MBL fold metallo-hydrolase [Chloroflexia bacterium]|nr:MBL fold metallo-hydrolase [Chloroflexia bacterium]